MKNIAANFLVFWLVFVSCKGNSGNDDFLMMYLLLDMDSGSNTYTIGDLAVTSVVTGGDYTFDVSVQGATSLLGQDIKAETVTVYLSTNNVISDTDFSLGNVDIAAGNPSQTLTVAIPPSTVHGVYYLGLLNNTGRDVGVSTNTLTLGSPNSYSIGTLATTSASAGDSYSFDITVTGTAAETLTVYLSSNNIISDTDTSIGTIDITGASITQTATVTLPSTYISGDIVYVGLLNTAGTQVAVSTNTLAIKLSVAALTPAAYTVDSGYVAGSLAGGTEIDLYSFTAVANEVYLVKWDDFYDGSGTQTADVKVTAFKDDGKTILAELNNNAPFAFIDSGFTSTNNTNSRYVTGGSASSTLKIAVQCLSLSCSGGTYKFKVELISTALTVGSGTNTNYTLVSAKDNIYFHRFAADGSSTYTVIFEDLNDQAAAAYSQNIILYGYYLDPVNGRTNVNATFGAGIDNGYNLGAGISLTPAPAAGQIYLYSRLVSGGATGFGIKVN